jgi:hypothetical protein
MSDTTVPDVHKLEATEPHYADDKADALVTAAVEQAQRDVALQKPTPDTAAIRATHEKWRNFTEDDMDEARYRANACASHLPELCDALDAATARVAQLEAALDTAISAAMTRETIEPTGRCLECRCPVHCALEDVCERDNNRTPVEEEPRPRYHAPRNYPAPRWPGTSRSQTTRSDI